MSAAAERIAQPGDDPDMLGAALAYAGRGLPVFPCNPATKRPLTANGFKDAAADEQTIRAWWSRWPQAMIGVPTGSPSGGWVLDVDDPALFERSCRLELPPTRRCSTGKGYHLWFRHDAKLPVRNTQTINRGSEKVWPLADLPGAEVRGEGATFKGLTH